jgi:hypothetical protein
LGESDVLIEIEASGTIWIGKNTLHVSADSVVEVVREALSEAITAESLNVSERPSAIYLGAHEYAEYLTVWKVLVACYTMGFREVRLVALTDDSDKIVGASALGLISRQTDVSQHDGVVRRFVWELDSDKSRIVLTADSKTSGEWRSTDFPSFHDSIYENLGKPERIVVSVQGDSRFQQVLWTISMPTYAGLADPNVSLALNL